MALHLPILDKCNIMCDFCSAWGRGGGFDLGYLKGQIDQDQTGHVQISGGDPMLREHGELVAILRHCKERGKIVEFQTNATLITQIPTAHLEELLRYIDYFNVNFSAHTPELDYKVTAVREAFAWREQGVKELLRRGVTVRLTYIVHGVNYAQAPEFVRYVNEELPGARWIQFSFVKAMGLARDNAEVVPRYETVAPALNEAMGLCQELGMTVMVDHIPVCFVEKYKDFHVDYKKMVNKQQGIFLREKQKVAECDTCYLKGCCPGPRVDYLDIYQTLKA